MNTRSEVEQEALHKTGSKVRLSYSQTRINAFIKFIKGSVHLHTCPETTLKLFCTFKTHLGPEEDKWTPLCWELGLGSYKCLGCRKKAKDWCTKESWDSCCHNIRHMTQIAAGNKYLISVIVHACQAITQGLTLNYKIRNSLKSLPAGEDMN